MPYAGISRIFVHRNNFIEARQYALKAPAFDDGLSEAHEVYALTLFENSWNFTAAEKEFLRAIKLNPSNPWTHVGYAYYLASAGRKEEALRQSKLAQAADPLETWFAGVEALVLFQNGETEAGIKAARSALQKDPTQLPTIHALRNAYISMSRFEDYFDITQCGGILSTSDLEAQQHVFRRNGRVVSIDSC